MTQAEPMPVYTQETKTVKESVKGKREKKGEKEAKMGNPHRHNKLRRKDSERKQNVRRRRKERLSTQYKNIQIQVNKIILKKERK